MKTLDKLDAVGEKILDKISGGLDKTEAVIQSTVEFIQTQAPNVLHDIVAFERGLSVAHLVMILTFGLVISWGYKAANKADDQEWREGSFRLVFTIITMVVGAIAELISVISFACNVKDYIKAWVAPNLYVLEYVAHLVREIK